MPRLRILIFCLTLFFSICTIAAASPPQVVATIKPLHALAVGILGDIAAPKLLIKGGHSPHSYSLRPSDAKALADADLVLWIGPELESFLSKPLENLAQKAKKLALLHHPELIRLPQRTGGTWGTDDHHDEHEITKKSENPRPQEESYNPHLWLDPQNAIKISHLLAETLSQMDPANRPAYQQNALILQRRLEELNRDISQQLQPIHTLPYLVFHDAYPYFEQRYNLHPLGAISVSPEHRPGAKRISLIRSEIKASGARCVFAEPQFKPQLVKILIAGTSAQSGTLDPLGADLQSGVESYFTLLRNMSENLRQCLQSPDSQ